MPCKEEEDDSQLTDYEDEVAPIPTDATATAMTNAKNLYSLVP